MTESASVLWKKLKPYAVRDLGGGAGRTIVVGGGSGGALTEHDLDGAYHDLSEFQIGYVLRGTGSGTAGIGALSHSYLTGVGANDHHDQQHSVIGSDHAFSGAAGQLVGLTATDTGGLITPVSNSVITPNTVLKSDATGDLIIAGLTVPNIDTTSGDLTIAPAANLIISAPTSITGNTDITGTLDVTSDTDIGGTFNADGAATLGSTLDVTGDTTLNADLTAGGLLWDTSVGHLWLNNGSLGSMGAAVLRPKNTDIADVTLWLQQITGQTGQLLKIADDGNNDLIVITGDGDLQSGNFSAGNKGWQMRYNGDLEANNATIRGTLQASVFQIDEYSVSAGTEIWAHSGGAVYEAVNTSGGGDSITLKIEHPATGAIPLFRVGDVIRMKTLGIDLGENANIQGNEFWQPTTPETGLQTIVADIWGTVTAVSMQTDYQQYTVDIEVGPACTIRAGTAVINYGHSEYDEFLGEYTIEPPGHIMLTATERNSPWIAIRRMDTNTPWVDGFTDHLKLGNLENVYTQFTGSSAAGGNLTRHAWGMAVSVDLSDRTEPHAVFSNLGVGLFKSDILLSASEGDLSGRIWADGSFIFSPDIADTDAAGIRYESGGSGLGRNAWDLDAGDIVIGAPGGNRMVWDQSEGELSIVSGSLATSATTDAEMRALNKPEGLYLASHAMGYWNGTDWGTRISANGSFRFGYGGPVEESDDYPGALIYDSRAGKLYGYDGTTPQWWTTIEDGRLYAAGGDMRIDSGGLQFSGTAAGTWQFDHAVAWRTANWGDVYAYIVPDAVNVTPVAAADQLKIACGGYLYSAGMVSIVGIGSDDSETGFHVAAGGQYVFDDIPTSSAGLPSGAIYSDGGTLKIVA